MFLRAQAEYIVTAAPGATAFEGSLNGKSKWRSQRLAVAEAAVLAELAYAVTSSTAAMKRIYLLGILLALAGCAKDAPDAGLPAATQEGKNTGGCLINGERFVATGWGTSLLSNPIPPLSGGFSFDSVYILRLHGQYQERNTTVMLFFRAQQPGTYLLNQNTPYYPQGDPSYVLDHATLSQFNSGGELYGTSFQNTGKIICTYASVSRGISAGTFEFTAASTFDRTKTVTVTSGRFDRKQ